MSSYTVELRQLIQNGYDIGLKDYPIFDESYRETLNNKIIMHYWMREIGAETAGLFKLYLNRTMGEIMPYYNQLYKSTQIDFDPLNAYNYSETNMELENVESDGTRTDTADGKSLYSDTPQGLLDNGAIADEKYLTSATLNDSSASSTANNLQKRDRNFEKKVRGNMYHNLSELLKDYRETFLNIDMEIINNPELQNCFMKLY
nr:MAG TPA: Lower collar protein [Caudoviricetes sp.]